MNYLELPAPHGFLIWRGKQTAIVTIEPIEHKQLAIVANDEAYGTATLSKQPAILNVDTFDQEEYFNEHRISPEERRLFYPGAEKFYLYRLVAWEPFNDPVPFQDGDLCEVNCSDKQRSILETVTKLPKTIILDKDAVTFDGEQFTASHNSDYINQVLRATYDTELKQVDTPLPLSLYQLALVRVPNPHFREKKKVKQVKQMPWSIEERDNEFCVIKDEDGKNEGCHKTMEEAEAQIMALGMVESESAATNQPTTDVKQEESISQFVNRISEQFREMFKMESPDGYFDCPWVRDVYDSHLIAEDDGILYRVNYMDTENGVVIFGSPGTWTEVELTYTDKAAKLLKHFESTHKPSPTWKDKLKAAAKTVMDFVSLESGGEIPLGENKDIMLDNVDLSKPYGIAVKTVNGEPWHFTWSTNSFEDRENEIFSIKALENFVDEAEQLNFKGTFDFWHIANTDFATKEWKAIIGKFLVEAGPYMDNEAGKSAKKFFSKHKDNHPEIAPEGWGASPEYRYLPEDRTDGVYDWLWITKTSTLPKSAAANIWTRGSQIMNDQQKKAAIEVFGKEFVENLENATVKQTEDLQAAGVNHKSNGDDTQPAMSDSTQFDMDVFSDKFNKQFEADFAPILNGIMESLEGLKFTQTELATRLQALEKGEEVKQNNEMPRWAFQLKRASESEDTEAEDELKSKKPREEAIPQSTVASAFFKS